MNRRDELHNEVKSSIAIALFQLMEHKSFSDITITEIILRAGVARASYYRNYKSKEDIIMYFLDESVKSFTSAPLANLSREGAIRVHAVRLLKHTALYKRELRSLFKAGLSGMFLDSLNRVFEEFSPNKFTGEKLKWIRYSHAGTLFNIIYMWIGSDMKESPEDIADSFMFFADKMREINYM